jgi:spore germination cell wall hydrolase CwlJ-like protein
MPFDPLRLQIACKTYARKTHNAVLFLLAAIALTVSGVLAAVVSAPVDAATGGRVEARADTALSMTTQQDAAFADQQSDFSAFPDLVAEFAALTGAYPLDTSRMESEFAPARPFAYGGSYEDFGTALDCLATAAWYEAGNDPAGQRSVIQVVLNRVSHPSFPKSVCAVVFQGAERVTGCQFSFTCDGSMERRTPSHSAWTRARARALAALSGEVDPTVGQATHFHADYVAPQWSSQLEPLAQVGAHIFYRWPGKRGRLLGSSVHTPEVAGILPPELDIDPTGFGSIADTPSAVPSIQSEIEALSSLPAAMAAPASPPGTRKAMLPEVAATDQADLGALDALAGCEGGSACQVSGYGSDGQLDSNRSTPTEAGDRPDVVDSRDPILKMDVPLWDCEQPTRPNAEVCLTASAAPLDQLVREPASDPMPAVE